MDRRRLLGVLATAGVAGCLRLAESGETPTGTGNGIATGTPSPGDPATESPEPTGTDPSEDDTATSNQSTVDLSGEWPQPRFDTANTGNAPDTRGLKRDPAITWRTSLPSEIPSLGPAVADNMAFVPDSDGALLALDIDTGSARWTAQVVEGDNLQAAAVQGQRVITTSKQGLVTALGLNGRRIWEFEVGETPINGHYYMLTAGATPAGNSVYVGSGTGTVYSLALDDGSIEWETDIGVFAGGSTPAVAADRLYIGDLNGRLHATSTAGELAWSQQLPGADAIVSAPAVSGGTVYVSTISADDGNPIEQPNIGYLSDRSLSGGLHAVDSATGDVRWSVEFDQAVYTSPAIGPDHVVTGCWDGNLYAYFKDGTRAWFYPIGGGPDGGPAIADGVVYAGGGGAVHAVSLDSGRSTWSLGVETTPTSPALVDGGVVLGDFDDQENDAGGNCYLITQG